MKYEDDDLKKLLNPLKEKTPDALMMKRWQNAVQAEVNKLDCKKITFTKWMWVAQLTAATVVGVVVGSLLMKSHQTSGPQPVLVAQISVDDATFEHSRTNLD